MMNFGQALEAVKAGKKIARQGWNGVGQFVIKAGGYTVDEARPGSDYAKAGIVGQFTIQPHLDLKNAQGHMQPGWVPSQGDLFADDWLVLQQCTDERMCENCYSTQAPCKNNQPTRGQMVEYVQQAIKEGYTSYYGLPENGIAWLSDECLKVDYGIAWEYYNLAADENGKASQRDLGE